MHWTSSIPSTLISPYRSPNCSQLAGTRTLYIVSSYSNSTIPVRSLDARPPRTLICDWRSSSAVLVLVFIASLVVRYLCIRGKAAQYLTLPLPHDIRIQQYHGHSNQPTVWKSLWIERGPNPHSWLGQCWKDHNSLSTAKWERRSSSNHSYHWIQCRNSSIQEHQGESDGYSLGWSVGSIEGATLHGSWRGLLQKTCAIYLAEDFLGSSEGQLAC